MSPAAGYDPLVLAIDQGTSATKAILVDATGRLLHRGTVRVHQQHPQPGRAEQDPLELWASVQQAVAAVLNDADPAHVQATGLSTQRESILLWERGTGRPLSPLIGWQDNRGGPLCARLRDAGHQERVRAVTGLPLDAMFSASKAAALLDTHDPDRRRSRRGELCLGTVDSWLLWQLNGQHVIETGNASRTLLLDITTGDWDPWLLDLFNVPAPTLPTVQRSTGPFGTCHGLGPSLADTPVTGVLGDSHAALFAHAGWQPGRVKVTYGTGSSVMGLTGGPSQPLQGAPIGSRADIPAGDPAGVARTIAWDLHGPVYAVEGNIRSSGATLMWLARLLGTTPGQIAADAAADSDGVTVVPAFNGLGAPWWDDRARGTITGLSDGTTHSHLSRAALESIAFQVEDVVAAVEHSTGPITVIRADGGPSTNATLMQLQANTSGRQVITTPVSELSALGAAHLAGLGCGLWSQTDLDQLPRGDHTAYQPSTSTAERASLAHRWHTSVNAARRIAATTAGDADPSTGTGPHPPHPGNGADPTSLHATSKGTLP